MTSKNHPSYPYVLYMTHNTKKEFKYQVKKHQTLIIKERAKFLSSNDCFKEIKKRRNNQNTAPNSLNGFAPPLQVKMWSDHFQNVFQATSKPKKAPFKPFDPKFDLNDLEKVLKRLNIKKAYKNHKFWNIAPISAKKVLLKCINNWALSKDKAWDFLLTTINPILKSTTKPQNFTSSYRPIALSTSEAWITEQLILDKSRKYLITKDEQFGYKKAHSTIHCIQIAKDV